MEDNFRNVLIILSAIVISAIFIHGLWTIRKEKNPYKLKTNKDKIEPLARDFDGRGFDQDGVGQVKVIKTSEQDEELTSDIEMQHNVAEKAEYDQQTGELFEKPLTKNDAEVPAINQSTLSSKLDDELSPLVGDELILEAETPKIKVVKVTPEEKPLYKEPVSRPKPLKAQTLQERKPVMSKAKLKRNQMEINFGELPNIDDDVMPNIQLEPLTEPSLKDTSAKVERQTTLDPQVIILSVVMPANQYMSGASLLPSLLTLGMKYGEMNIFHRHQDNAGNGAVTFSLANMMNPGSFDLDTMETFATQGVSLFMTLPNAGDSFAVFEQMLGAAKQLAQEFNAQILDDKRNVLTKQTEQHYMSQIREFDRKSRIAAV